MKRNRNIRVPLEHLSLLRHPACRNDYFGEEVAASSDDSDLILADVHDFGSKSSSSSLSWGEEYKSEASKKVRDELDRMDRVLRGEEPIPDHYDKEEYEEWMEFFPNLSVVGTAVGTTAVTHSSPLSYHSETLAVHPEETVIYEKNSPEIIVNGLDVDSYLKVAPLAPRLNRRQSSSRSLISSEISSSKWLKDEEYESLPFLKVKGIRNGAPKGILKHTLVLPPIENSLRSISATPRRESKSLSALSVDQKYSGFKRKGRDLCK